MADIEPKKISTVYEYLEEEFPGSEIAHHDDARNKGLKFLILSSHIIYPLLIPYKVLEKTGEDIQSLFKSHSLAKKLREKSITRITEEGIKYLPK